MASSLREHLSNLASSFADSVLQAIRAASIEDLLAESSGPATRPARRAAPRAAAVRPSVSAPVPARPAARAARGRLARRNAGDIAQVVDRIVGVLRGAPRGLRAEEIRKRLGMQSKELPRPLKDAVDAGRLGKSGQKRATTYFIKGAAAPAAGGRSASKASRKKK
jgi:hypothetical protein